MTPSDRIDEVLAERLRADAPASPPGGLLEATLHRIEGTHQRAGRQPSRTVLGLLAAAAVIVLAVWVGTQLPALLDPTGNEPTPTATPSDGIVELPLDTPRRHCIGDADELRAIYRIPNGSAFWTVLPRAGLAPEFDEVEVPLLVVVYQGVFPGPLLGPPGAPARESPAPGTVDVCVETVDGSNAIGGSAVGIYTDIPLQPVVTDWGPLAVVTASGDMALTEGTLRITGDCVFLEADGARQLLVWPAAQTAWIADTGAISFTTLAGDARMLTTGDVLSLGGGGWSAEGGQDPREWAAEVDWINPPDDACLTDRAWFVTDVLPPVATPVPAPTASPVAVTWHPILSEAELTEYTGVQGVAEWGDGLMAYGRADHTHGGIWLSADGVTWTAASVPESPANTVVFVTDVIPFDGHYLAFGTLAHPDGSGPLGGVLWTSQDGHRWTELARGVPGGFIAVHEGVILANTLYEIPTVDDLFTSRDGGVTWSPVVIPDAWHIAGRGIVHDGRLLLPGGLSHGGVYDSTAAIWSSTDASSWARSDLGGALIIELLPLPDGTFLAISSTGDSGDTGRAWASDLVADWELVSEIGLCCAFDFASTPNGIVGVGFLDDSPTGDLGHALITTTMDGRGWSNARIDGYLNGVTWSERLGTVLLGRDPDDRPGVILGWPVE